MLNRHWLLFVPVLLFLFNALSVRAQTEDSDKSGNSDTSAYQNAETETDTDNADSDSAADSDSDSAEEEESASLAEDSGSAEEEESASQSSAPDDLELDYAALGEMNPSEDLSESGFLNKNGSSEKEAVENWTARNLELFEVHGYFRVRPELYHKFYIRNDPALFPLDIEKNGEGHNQGCDEKKKCATLAGANMRFRFAPTINLSEEVRINSQIDFLDNVMLGSTPQVYQHWGDNYQTVSTDEMYGYRQGGGVSDYVHVRRVWGEVESSFGQLRFGRMPSNWGTGMLYNSGDGLDSDFGDSVDRISFAFKLNGWLIMPAFDFPNEGLSLDSAAGRPFDVSQMDDAYRIVAVMAYQHEQEDQRAMLKKGDWLINTGLHFSYHAKNQSFYWMDDSNPDFDETINNQIENYKRDVWGITPDIWFQFLKGTFHLEMELAFDFGQVGKPSLNTVADQKALDIISWGSVFQADYGLLSDQLRIGFEFGIASGDKNVEGLYAPSSFDQVNGDSSKYSVFSFNPAYNVDFILYRHILGSVSGTYYFKPWIRYDFLKAVMGKRLGVQFDALFSRAFFSKSTISNSSGNLGIELDGRVDFASADNFYASLKYGVLFPLGGFKGLYEWTTAGTENSFTDDDLSIPQTLQLLLGIKY
jgi:uncharacterized protein (TIGR04551 family)